MKRHRAFTVGVAVALLAVIALAASVDSTSAGTFNPTLKAQLADSSPEANSDFTVDFNVPSGDVNFAGVVSFIPQYWGVVPGKDLDIGAQVGTLASQATLGLINAPCNTTLPVVFTMLNASTDPTDTVEFLDSDDEDDDQDAFQDKDDNGLRDAIDKYPAFIARLLTDENDAPLVPLRRSAGFAFPASVNVLLQFLVFEPGTLINEDIDSAPERGYPSVTLLQNIGDPDVVPAPSAITDFCTPLSSSNTSFGFTKDNPDTDADESGKESYKNPKDATYTFITSAFGQRDADGDGYENGLDTCVFVANRGDPRIQNDGDDDSDGMDAACDPDDNDVDSDADRDGYDNRGDNCPQVANGEEQEGNNQEDDDRDQIGNLCDTEGNGPDVEDGDLARAEVSQDIKVGGGSGTPGYPDGFPRTPGGGGGDDDGGGSGLIIIIVIVVVAVLAIGGGAAMFMRRRGT